MGALPFSEEEEQGMGVVGEVGGRDWEERSVRMGNCDRAGKKLIN